MVWIHRTQIQKRIGRFGFVNLPGLCFAGNNLAENAVLHDRLTFVTKRGVVNGQNQAFNALLFLYREQELLGHKDVSTTMIYTHVAQQGRLAVRSPLDITGT